MCLKCHKFISTIKWIRHRWLKVKSVLSGHRPISTLILITFPNRSNSQLCSDITTIDRLGSFVCQILEKWYQKYSSHWRRIIVEYHHRNYIFICFFLQITLLIYVVVSFVLELVLSSTIVSYKYHREQLFWNWYGKKTGQSYCACSLWT